MVTGRRDSFSTASPGSPLDLAEDEQVSLLVTPATNAPGACQRDPGIDEVRRRLAKIPGTLTADFIAEREDRRFLQIGFASHV